ncbi:MAG: phage holin [Oscillospiraceae bacterium]|jgi:SPP1 family holin|nr:phage holin [Oscillospiraceae bacterium]
MKIKTETVVRTACLALALVNQVLTALGKSPLDFGENEVNELVSSAVVIVTAAAAWWKNNSFTSAALIADERLEQLRGKNI